MATLDPKTPTRNQLFKVFQNHELVRLFEKLFEIAGDLTPTDIATLTILIEEANINAGIASSKSNQAIGSGISNEIKSKSNGVLMWLSM